MVSGIGCLITSYPLWPLSGFGCDIWVHREKWRIGDGASGEKMHTGQMIGRYFAYIPAMLPLFLDLLWVGADKKKQGWHDKLAGAVVICDRAKEPVLFDRDSPSG